MPYDGITFSCFVKRKFCPFQLFSEVLFSMHVINVFDLVKLQNCNIFHIILSTSVSQAFKDHHEPCMCARGKMFLVKLTSIMVSVIFKFKRVS